MINQYFIGANVNLKCIDQIGESFIVNSPYGIIAGPTSFRKAYDIAKRENTRPCGCGCGKIIEYSIYKVEVV